MVTRTIPHDEWAEYFDELTNPDEGVLVTVEILGAALGNRVIAHELALQGLTLVEKGSAAGEIEIQMGASLDDHFSHVIAAPTRIMVLETEEGDPQTLHIDSAEDVTTMIHFHSAHEISSEEDEEEEED